MVRCPGNWCYRSTALNTARHGATRRFSRPLKSTAAERQAVRPLGSTVSLQIAYLDEHVDSILSLATWHHETWHTVTPHLSVADRIAGFERRARRGSIPTGFVALIDSTVVGMACLVECDIDSHCHLTPWLATVLSHRLIAAKASDQPCPGARPRRRRRWAYRACTCSRLTSSLSTPGWAGRGSKTRS